MTDFSYLNQMLQSGDIFEENTVYEITFSGITYIPPKVLKGLKVNRFILDDSDVTVAENVLEGVNALYWFRVRRSSIKEIPDFSIVKDYIMKLNIDSSHLTSLDGKNLQNLTQLSKLSFFNNSIRFIHPDVFKGTDNVQILDLSHNLLTSLPPKLLDPMKKLKKFAVSSNNLLHVNGLFSVTHPEYIYLDFNNISDADSVLVYNMNKVETFVLASNPLKNISVNSFNGKIPKVKFLYLDHCQIRDFNISHYEHLNYLNTLDLSYNLIEEISNQEIGITHPNFAKPYIELDLIGNQIRKFDAEIKPTIKRLYLSENKLKVLNTTLQDTQMTEVQVARNKLQYLTDQDLKSVHGTENLEFQENEIRRIDTGAFAPIRNNLHYLDLSYNYIKSLNRSIRLLSQLKLLNLTHNLIQTFEKGEFTGLNELSELYLEQNHIKALGQLQYLEWLQYLVITHNDIESITPEQVPKKLRFMYLADNPLKCDCRFQPFLLWLNASDSLATDIDLCLKTDLKNNTRDKVICPEMCSCGCANDGNVYFISIDCSSKNLSVIPEFLSNSFTQMEDNITAASDLRYSYFIDQNIYPSLHIEDRILGISLENNRLESFENAHLPPNLLQLYLAGNRLRRLPESTLYNLQNLKQMSLSGNSWDCDCNALKFKKWLTSKYDVIRDINNTRCGISDKGDTNLYDKIIWTLTDLDVCPTDIGMIASVAFGILAILLIGSAAKILYTKYELNIKVFLYSHGFTFVKEEDLDYDKIFDAFISFSHKDDAFVIKEIISVIEEKDPNIRLCLHYRNFRPGEFIYDNIIRAVQNSKRTVLILSKNFLESEWCLMEFRAAHIQALEDKVHRIIVIKFGDLPEEIDPAIKVYLDSTTYLTWGDKYFWNNLLYVLPTSSSARDLIPKNIILGKYETEMNHILT